MQCWCLWLNGCTLMARSRLLPTDGFKREQYLQTTVLYTADKENLISVKRFTCWPARQQGLAESNKRSWGFATRAGKITDYGLCYFGLICQYLTTRISSTARPLVRWCMILVSCRQVDDSSTSHFLWDNVIVGRSLSGTLFGGASSNFVPWTTVRIWHATIVDSLNFNQTVLVQKPTILSTSAMNGSG